ncbi:hypothetical protein BKA64DRAFT_705393 [Cadophora sp. MPI-SDFR-AT-0126]|nr:hypothetical protein BKA64DRAFT_705393 [Leotiomycetes sp. MPI-SDFR-AT-0126]
MAQQRAQLADTTGTSLPKPTLQVSETVAVSFGLSTTIISIIAIYVAIRMGRRPVRLRDIELGLLESHTRRNSNLFPMSTNTSSGSLISHSHVPERHEFQHAVGDVFYAMSRMLHYQPWEAVN